MATVREETPKAIPGWKQRPVPPESAIATGAAAGAGGVAANGAAMARPASPPGLLVKAEPPEKVVVEVERLERRLRLPQQRRVCLQGRPRTLAPDLQACEDEPGEVPRPAHGRSRMFERITFDPKVMGGRACIRGMRMTVSHIVNLVANGMAADEICREYPVIESEDIRQALQYAAG